MNSLKSIFSYIAVVTVFAMLPACGGGGRPSDSTHMNSSALLAATETVQSNTFARNRGNYAITKSDTDYLVEDLTDHSIVLVSGNTQSLVFADVSVNLVINAKAYNAIPESDLNSLVELYVAYFNRVPSADGLSYWIDQLLAGQTLDQIGESFYQAGIQYSNLTGYSPTMQDVDFVKLIYKNVLGRTDPTQAGLDYWTSSLESGSQTRGTLIRTILTSAHTYKGDPTYGWVADLLDNKVAVAKYFAIQQGLSYLLPTDAIANGMAIAAAVTATDVLAAKSTVPVADSAFNLGNIGLTPSPTLQITASTNQTSAGGTPVTLVASKRWTSGEVVWTLASGNRGTLDVLAGDIVHYIPPPAEGEGSDLSVMVTATVANISQSIALTIQRQAGVILYAGVAGGAGNIDGVGADARFNGAAGTAVDTNGNTYVADAWNNTIRKITPTGVVTTLAGKAGVEGSTDGIGVNAQFRSPFGVAVDTTGIVYVADTYNCVVRKISTIGTVTTFAGSAGNCGNSDGTGSAARFYTPLSIAVDVVGNVYVGDYSAVRKISRTGKVTTLAGIPNIGGSVDGVGSNARLGTASGLTVDRNENVYVADSSNNTVRRITPTGTVTTFAGRSGVFGSSDGIGADARFGYPAGIATDSSNNIYVSDSGNGVQTENDTIRKITPSGVVTTLAGSPGISGSVDDTGVSASFRSPSGLATDASGNLYVADTGNNTIRTVTAGGSVRTLAGTPIGAGSTDGAVIDARFNEPLGITSDVLGNLYIADTYNHNIRKISPLGIVSTYAGRAGVNGNMDGVAASATFAYPYGIASDTNGNLYVVENDTVNQNVRKISVGGMVSTFAGSVGYSGHGAADGIGGAAQFFEPAGSATDASGNVFIADKGNNSIRKVTPAGVVTTFAGTSGFTTGSADGTGTSASFSWPTGVATDAAGNVYVADTGNNTIRKITPTGVVSTLAGLAGAQGSADGTGVAARFNMPASLVCDASANVYVADFGNSTIRKIAPSGQVTTVAGIAGQVGLKTGVLPGTLAYPNGITLIGPKALAVTMRDAVVKVLLP